MAKVFDDLATKFMSFSDALEQQFGDLSIDFSLPSKTAKGGQPGAPDPAGDARALSRAAEEREAAKKRGEEILQQLPPGYFDSSFDALKHELCQLGPDAKQDDIDVVVDRLTSAMEVSSYAGAVLTGIPSIGICRRGASGGVGQLLHCTGRLTGLQIASLQCR